MDQIQVSQTEISKFWFASLAKYSTLNFDIQELKNYFLVFDLCKKWLLHMLTLITRFPIFSNDYY